MRFNELRLVLVVALLSLASLSARTQTCLDHFIEELKTANKMPSMKGLCFDEAAYWKFWKAGTLLSKQLDADWKASYCYKQANSFGFKFAWFNIEYGMYLYQHQQLSSAYEVFNQIPSSDPLFQNAELKKAEILLWLGSYNIAEQKLNQIKSSEKNQITAAKNELLRRKDSLSAPVVKMEGISLSDNQPLSSYGLQFEYRKGTSKWWNYQVNLSSTYFGLADVNNVQYELQAQNTVALPRMNSRITGGIGISAFGKLIKPIGLLAFKTQLTSQWINDLRYEAKIYDFTRGSIGASILIHQVTNRTTYSRRDGLNIETVLSFSQRANSNSKQCSWYSWMLSPFIVRGIIEPRLGIFAGYSTSNQLEYESVLSYDALVASGNWSTIQGEYPFWFTPMNMRVIGGIIDVQSTPVKKLTIGFTNTTGFGRSSQPYLQLGEETIDMKTTTLSFVPFDLKLSIAYQATNKLQFIGKYEYRSTIFNAAHQLTISCSKRL